MKGCMPAQDESEPKLKPSREGEKLNEKSG